MVKGQHILTIVLPQDAHDADAENTRLQLQRFKEDFLFQRESRFAYEGERQTGYVVEMEEEYNKHEWRVRVVLEKEKRSIASESEWPEFPKWETLLNFLRQRRANMPDYKEQIARIIDAEAHERVWDKLADVCIEEEHDVERIIARLDAKMGEESTNFLIFALFVYLTKNERVSVYGMTAEEDAELVPCAYTEDTKAINEIAWYTSAETDDFIVMPGYSKNRRR